MNITKIEGVSLIDDNDMVVKSYKEHGTFEPESIQVWKSNIELHPNMMVIDVGAYTGLYTIIAASLGAQVFSFEPNPKVCERLNENIRLNQVQGVHLSEDAMSDVHGTLKFWIKDIPLTSAGQISDEGQQSVPVRFLDMVVRNKTNISTIKIDVEGGELSVLKGARKILEQSRPIVIVEALDSEHEEELIDFMSEIGYTQYVFCDNRNIVFQE